MRQLFLRFEALSTFWQTKAKLLAISQQIFKISFARGYIYYLGLNQIETELKTDIVSELKGNGFYS
jgi:hypothetical protein